MKAKPMKKMTKKDLLELINRLTFYIPEDAELWEDEDMKVIFG